MLFTDIKMTVNGVSSTCSFDNHKMLYDFMVRENIDKCKVSASIASVNVTGFTEVSKIDLERFLNL